MDKNYDDSSEKQYSEKDAEETEEQLEFDDLSDEYSKYTQEIKETLEEEEALNEDDYDFDFAESENVLKSKKYVIQIYPDNVDSIEEMSPDERNDYINELITESHNKSYEENETQKVSNSIQQITVIILTIIIGLPIIFYLINISLTLTSNSYKGIQMNFEKLYLERGRVSR